MSNAFAPAQVFSASSPESRIPAVTPTVHPAGNGAAYQATSPLETSTRSQNALPDGDAPQHNAGSADAGSVRRSTTGASERQSMSQSQSQSERQSAVSYKDGPDFPIGSLDERDPPRRHGMHGPFDEFQPIAVFAYFIFAATFAILQAPLFTPGIHKIVTISACGVFFILSITAYYIASTKECHEPQLSEGPTARISEAALDYTEPPEGMVVCYECRIVTSHRTKHCWKCNKCVSDFDHHCKWLNHCVGDRNYIAFASFLSLTVGVMVTQCTIGAYFLIECAKDYDTFYYRLNRTYDVTNDHGVRAFAIFIGAALLLEIAATLLLSQLFFLHIYLSWRGMSTYDNILENRRQLSREKADRIIAGVDDGSVPCSHDCFMWRHAGVPLCCKGDTGDGSSACCQSSDEKYTLDANRKDRRPSLEGTAVEGETSRRGSSIHETTVPIEMTEAAAARFAASGGGSLRGSHDRFDTFGAGGDSPNTAAVHGRRASGARRRSRAGSVGASGGYSPAEGAGSAGATPRIDEFAKEGFVVDINASTSADVPGRARSGSTPLTRGPLQTTDSPVLRDGSRSRSNERGSMSGGGGGAGYYHPHDAPLVSSSGNFGASMTSNPALASARGSSTTYPHASHHPARESVERARLFGRSGRGGPCSQVAEVDEESVAVVGAPRSNRESPMTTPLGAGGSLSLPTGAAAHAHRVSPLRRGEAARRDLDEDFRDELLMSASRPEDRSPAPTQPPANQPSVSNKRPPQDRQHVVEDTTHTGGLSREQIENSERLHHMRELDDDNDGAAAAAVSGSTGSRGGSRENSREVQRASQDGRGSFTHTPPPPPAGHVGVASRQSTPSRHSSRPGSGGKRGGSGGPARVVASDAPSSLSPGAGASAGAGGVSASVSAGGHLPIPNSSVTTSGDTAGTSGESSSSNVGAGGSSNDPPTAIDPLVSDAQQSQRRMSDTELLRGQSDGGQGDATRPGTYGGRSKKDKKDKKAKKEKKERRRMLEENDDEAEGGGSAAAAPPREPSPVQQSFSAMPGHAESPSPRNIGPSVFGTE